MKAQFAFKIPCWGNWSPAINRQLAFDIARAHCQTLNQFTFQIGRVVHASLPETPEFSVFADNEVISNEVREAIEVLQRHRSEAIVIWQIETYETANPDSPKSWRLVGSPDTAASSVV